MCAKRTIDAQGLDRRLRAAANDLHLDPHPAEAVKVSVHHRIAAAKAMREAADEIERLRECLTAIAEYEPSEVMKDDFAYDRMVESYREAARNGLAT